MKQLGRLIGRLLAGPMGGSTGMFLRIHVLAHAVHVEVGASATEVPAADLRERRKTLMRTTAFLTESLEMIRATADRWEWNPGPPARISFEFDRAVPPPRALGSHACR